jgi:hypothetical protein
MRGTEPEETSLVLCTALVKLNGGNYHNFHKVLPRYKLRLRILLLR